MTNQMNEWASLIRKEGSGREQPLSSEKMHHLVRGLNMCKTKKKGRREGGRNLNCVRSK